MAKKTVLILVVTLVVLAAAIIIYALIGSSGNFVGLAQPSAQESSQVGNEGGSGSSGSSTINISSGASAGVNSGSSAEEGGRGAFLTDNNKTTGDRHYCENINPSSCTSTLESVCGWFDPNKVSCTEGPCVKRYVTECIACNDTRVVYWTEGECPYHG